MRLKDIKLNCIAKTEPTFEFNGNYDDTKFINQYNIYSGLIARNCVTTKSFDEMASEDLSKSLQRAESVKTSGHHSVFDHEYFTFEIQNASKAFAMVINNEKAYNTTEKSMRYTANPNNMTKEEQTMYFKWLATFEDLIAKKYAEKYPKFFTESRITKLAQENARYLLSIYSPTSLIYTASLRQLNYLYNFMQKEIANDNTNDFYNQLKPNFESFCEELMGLGIIDKELMEDNKNRHLSLYSDYKPVNYYGDVYSTTYFASLAYLAQAQRHRTIDYSFSMINKDMFYYPQIIRQDKALMEEWLRDCEASANLTDEDIYRNYIQASMGYIAEKGTLDNFILKMKERKCTFAQLEINNKTNEILKRYVNALETVGHPRAEELKSYQKGARCKFVDYKCSSPCGFIEGINETRVI